MSLHDVEFITNPQPRCPVILLLDTSSSMSGRPIQSLNEGLKTFKQEIEQDELASLRVEVSIITFATKANLIQDFVTIDNFSPPHLTASGATAMGEAIEMALVNVEMRKNSYKSNAIDYYRPWVFLITDGAPTDEWRSAAQEVQVACANKKISFFAVGVEGARMDILKQIAHPGTPPVKLSGLKFNEMFKWLSNSMTDLAMSAATVSAGPTGGMVQLPPITGWAQVGY